MSPNVITVFIHAGDSTDEDGLQEFMDEVLRMKNFKHPNVMPMLGMTIMDDRPYMVLPYMAHGDMKSYISKQTAVSIDN
jgi:serine/threonine protein kinase